MKDAERDAAVEQHLSDLDDEIARLRRMEAALDRRLAEWDGGRRTADGGEDAGPRTADGGEDER